jgi:hypothetical protein
VRLAKVSSYFCSSHLTTAFVMSAKQEPESTQHAEVVANAAAEASKPGADTVRLQLPVVAACLLLLLLPLVSCVHASILSLNFVEQQLPICLHCFVPLKCYLHACICVGSLLQESQYECPFCVMMRKGGCDEVFKVCVRSAWCNANFTAPSTYHSMLCCCGMCGAAAPDARSC